MTISSYPFENTDTDEGQYTLLFREFAGSGVLGSYGSSALQVTGSGSSLQVSIAAGDAIVRGHMARNDASIAVNIDPNSSGSTRVDRIVLKLDPAANKVDYYYKKPSVGQGPPTLDQSDVSTYEMPLARINVPNGATNLAGAVVDERPFADMRTGIWTTDTRPGTAGYGPTPRRGQIGYNLSLGRWEFWNGATWDALIPATTSVSSWTATNGTDYQLAVSTSAPSSPTPTLIWIKPTA